MAKLFICILPALLLRMVAFGQVTTPDPFVLAGGQSYSLTEYSGTTFPPHMAIGRGPGGPGNFVIQLPEDAPNGNGVGKWRSEPLANGISYLGGLNYERGAFELALNATGRQHIKVRWKIRDITANNGTALMELQMRLDTVGNFTNLTNDQYTQGTPETPNGTAFEVQLPDSANNQPIVHVRWIYYGQTSTSGGGTGGGSGSNTNVNLDRLSLDQIMVTSEPYTALDVQMTRFSANPKENKVLLEWETVSEQQSDRFDIERSHNGFTFETIGSVQAAGDSRSLQQYSFSDNQPLQGVSFYRLKQLDFDGTAKYSATRQVFLGGDNRLSALPVPAVDRVTLSVGTAWQEDQPWQVYDLQGKLVRNGIWPAEQNTLQVPLAGFENGVYFFQVSSQFVRLVKSE